MDEPLVIDCDTCIMRDTSACSDCLVTFICGREPDTALVLEADEALAMRRLAHAGLVPHLRLLPRTG